MNTIDLRTLNEGTIRGAIGKITKEILRAMYGVDFRFDVDLASLATLMKEEENNKKFSIKGEPNQVKSYVKAVARMKFYLDAIVEFDKKHPMAIKRREELDQAVSEFEQETGISWPFKHEG